MKIDLVDLLISANFVAEASMARKLILAGRVKFKGKVMTNTAAQVQIKVGDIVQIGDKAFTVNDDFVA